MIEGDDTGLSSEQKYRIAKYVLSNLDPNKKRREIMTTIDPSVVSYPKPKSFNEGTKRLETE